jgi:ribosome biogenesis GTPase
VKLENLGYDSLFNDHFTSLNRQDLDPARIIAVNKGNYSLIGETGKINGELSGKFMFNSDSALELPTTGDWVAASFFDQNSPAIIHEILPRKSILKRRDPGKKLDYQLIAANIDTAFIIQALDTNFNLNRLERYLAMVSDGGIIPVILLSKSDLLSSNQLEEIKSQIGRVNSKYQWFIFSNKTMDGISDIHKLLLPQKTFCLLGSSGVGKTTLLNTLIGEEKFRIEEVRQKDNKGRHTTSYRQLIVLENGSLLIDTPGMRELGIIALESGISDTFEDIEKMSLECKFTDCTHTNEQGCALLESIQQGTLDQKKYDNYMKIKKETAFYQMSYLEKRNKDKSFGKMIKQVMKSKRKK